MQFSVIIVNYQVKHFLEQCICSVLNAAAGHSVQVIIIDNNSTDGSKAFIPARFPEVEYTWLPENLGFGKANNKALESATGEIIVFLNPDTLVPEDFFSGTLQFFNEHPDAGGMGVRMVDGTGNYLPESKRAFPSPLASLFKLTGFSVLFPKSPFFARYYLGHLSANEVQQVEVLAGACMLVRREVLNKTGAFDPVFFMYGEDIDLSYRIHKAGWKNYYLPEPSIIHFKGESTRKGSLNYVLMFYHAMALFVKKHFRGAGAVFFRMLLQAGIALRAAWSMLGRFFRSLGLPVLDALLAILSLGAVMWFWYAFVKPGIEPPLPLLKPAIPLFAGTLILSGYFSGLYDSWYKPFKTFSALLIGVLVVLAFYSIIPESWRFSRGIILFGGLLAAGLILLSRYLMFGRKIRQQGSWPTQSAWAIAGSKEEYDEVQALLEQWHTAGPLIGRISPDGDPEALGKLRDLHQLHQQIPFDVLVFCLGHSLRTNEVLTLIREHPDLARYRFHFRNTESMVGSDDTEVAGEVVTAASGYKLARPEFKRSKRSFDVLASLVILLPGLVLLPFSEIMRELWTEAWAVLFNQKTWIGLAFPPQVMNNPKPGVLNTLGQPVEKSRILPPATLQDIDENYARHYNWIQDFKILSKAARLG